MPQTQIVRRRRARRALRSNRRMPAWLLVHVTTFAVAVIGLGSGVVSLGVLQAHYSSGYAPLERMAEEHRSGQTYVYDREGPDDGMLLGVLTNATDNLSKPVTLGDVSRHLIEATLSTEDNRFLQHAGVDPMGLVPANETGDARLPERARVPVQLFGAVALASISATGMPLAVSRTRSCIHRSRSSLISPADSPVPLCNGAVPPPGQPPVESGHCTEGRRRRIA